MIEDNNQKQEYKETYNSGLQNRKSSISFIERVQVWLPLFLSISIAIGLLIGSRMSKIQHRPIVLMKDSEGKLKQMNKVDEILRYIDAKYLEGINQDLLEEAAIVGMLKKLDPHSSYISKSKIQSVKESLQGNFEGIGVEFFILDDTILVVGVIPEGPSDKAGVKIGDRFIKVDDTIVAGKNLNNQEVIKKLKGESGSTVKVELFRRSEEKTKEVNITRGQIPMVSVDAAFMLDNKTGYIRISRFSSQTFEEFMKAFEDLHQNKGMKDLLIDLRGNPGGYLNEATDILNQLFDDKRLLVYTEGRSYKRKEYKSNGRAYFKIGKIAVLINEGSASASEILAGAIQDNDRGIIVGRRSFGKGLVQEQYDLIDSSALRLTVARYYTPSGRLIQRPYKEGQSDEYEDDFEMRLQSGELSFRDSIHISDSTVYKTTGGRTVFGGGGIIPDIFVPIDTLTYNEYYLRLNLHIPSFVYRYMDKNYNSFGKYKTAESFAKNFIIDKKLLDDFFTYAVDKADLLRDDAFLKKVKNAVSVRIKAQIAEHLFRNEGYFRCMSIEDEDIAKALMELQRK